MQKSTFAAIVAVSLLVLGGQMMLHSTSRLDARIRSQKEDKLIDLADELETKAKHLNTLLHNGHTREDEHERQKDTRDAEKEALSTVEDTTPLEEALEKFKEKSIAEVSESCTKTKDFQSSKHFHDFKAPRHGGWRVPTSDTAADNTCNPRNFNPTTTETKKCVEYIANLENWKYLRPMDSILAKARTIKFIVQTKDPDVRAVIKVPQFKFLVEPYSELASFTLDKLIETNRVPPTAWVPVPVDWLRASMAVLMPDIYVQWVECFVFQRKGLSKLVKKWDGEVETMYMSVQLWMKGVKELKDTSLRLHHHDMERYFNPATEHHPKTIIEKWALGETSDLQVFDHIIGNNDRTPMKNAFAVGNCNEEGWDCTSLDNTEHFPRMVFLDQGSSFYSRDATRVSVFRGKESHICKFRKKTFNKVKQLEGKELLNDLKTLLPEKGFWTRWESWQAEGAQTRLNSLWAHMEDCEQQHGDMIYLD